MLNKAANILNIDGLIVYMVCSILKYENEDRINSFLVKNSNFEIFSFDLPYKNNKYSNLTNKNFMKTLPDTLLNYNIDGYFAAYLKKIK